jgi:hypothetical protein
MLGELTMNRLPGSSFTIMAFIAVFQLLFVTSSFAGLVLEAEQIVQASDVDIRVPGYSVPSFVFWNSDSLPDLVIGEGSGVDIYGKVRVYINNGTIENPLFADSFYAQAGGTDLVSAGSG